MEFKKKKRKRKNTLTQTIRFSGKTYENISKAAEENEISFNSVVNQIVEYFYGNESRE